MKKAFLLFVLLLMVIPLSCKKNPDEVLCKQACENMIEIMSQAKEKELDGLPKEVKKEFLLKITGQKEKISKKCIETCKKEGSVSSAECLVKASTLDDIMACKDRFTEK